MISSNSWSAHGELDLLNVWSREPCKHVLAKMPARNQDTQKHAVLHKKTRCAERTETPPRLLHCLGDRGCIVGEKRHQVAPPIESKYIV